MGLFLGMFVCLSAPSRCFAFCNISPTRWGTLLNYSLQSLRDHSFLWWYFTAVPSKDTKIVANSLVIEKVLITTGGTEKHKVPSRIIYIYCEGKRLWVRKFEHKMMKYLIGEFKCTRRVQAFISSFFILCIVIILKTEFSKFTDRSLRP